MSDMTHTLHYLLKMLDNMERLDLEGGGSDPKTITHASAD
jgi:hypothetical protein